MYILSWGSQVYQFVLNRLLFWPQLISSYFFPIFQRFNFFGQRKLCLKICRKFFRISKFLKFWNSFYFTWRRSIVTWEKNCYLVLAHLFVKVPWRTHRRDLFGFQVKLPPVTNLLYHAKVAAIPLSALPKNTTSELAVLFPHYQFNAEH